MNKKLIGIIAIVVVVAAGVFLMAGGGGPKPEDSFEQIKAAAQKKDVAGVEKYVDFDALAKSIARCDFILGAEADNPELAPLTAEIVAHAAKSFRAIAASGNIKDGAGDMFSDSLGELQKNTGFRSWSYVGTAGSKVNGDKAVVSVKVKDGALDKEYTLDVDMAKENDVWRVKGVSNLNALSAQRAQDVKAKLVELNKEVQDKISKAVSISDAKMTHFKDDMAIFTDPNKVKVSLVFVNNSDKTVTALSGYAELYKPGADKAVASYRINLPYGKTIAPGKSFAYSNSSSLGDGEDGTSSDQMAKDFGSFTQKFTITSIGYSDGSKLEPLRELPVK